MTRAQFLEAYRKLLQDRYPWAADAIKLDAAMAKVVETMVGPSKPWSHHGQSTWDAWKQIGGKGKPSLKALRALPIGEG